MPSDVKLPRFSPILSIAALEALLASTPSWLKCPCDAPDGNESRVSNAERGLVDRLKFGVDSQLEEDDIQELLRRGWRAFTMPSRGRGKKIVLTVYQHPVNGAQVTTSTYGSTVTFCPARVLFGRNDLVAEVTQRDLTQMAYAYTERLLPATTRHAWRGASWRSWGDGLGAGKLRNRRFLVWTLRNIDLCVQAKVPSTQAAFAAYRLASSQHSTRPPMIWCGGDVDRGPVTGRTNSLTFGVPPKKAIDFLPPEIREKLDTLEWNDELWKLVDPKVKKSQGRVSITLYDKGAYQKTKQGAKVTVGAGVEPGRFLRCEIRFNGIDGCAALCGMLREIDVDNYPDLPVIFRLPKKKVKVTGNVLTHAVWFDLDYSRLHHAVQAEVLDLQEKRLRRTTVEGITRSRPYPDGWFDALPEAERRVIWKLAKGKVNPTDAGITVAQRRQAMELAMTRSDLPNGAFNLFWQMWPRLGQHLLAENYQAAWSKDRKWKPGEAAKDLEMAKGRRV